MDKKAKIYVAGHSGLVGTAMRKTLQRQGYDNLLCKTFQECDLRDGAQVEALFARERPDYVILAAAKVGGIHANNTYPAEFIHDNLMIQSHVIHQSWKHGVKRLLFLGSACIYPRDCPQPIREEYLLSGPLEKTNEPYAIAKIAGLVQVESYNRQYGTRYISVMPNNLYGPGDNYDLQNSHVLPALIRKFHEAKVAGAASVEVWGTGTPRREFVFSEDMASACVYLLNQSDDSLFRGGHQAFFNIGSGQERTIRELAELVQKVIGFSGIIHWNTDKPDGTPRKLVDMSRWKDFDWKPAVTLEQGIALAYEDFKQRFA
ncbi:MAG TPA: GDP-L-fucose synthase [Candidatus Ozemobacteraceae bacterium]|nr:GDP-L-fucose synthase [Candidatus Ozemobacteraceae bacterium]